MAAKTENIGALIDHTFLKPAGDKDAVKRLCDEAVKAHFASVCVNPCEVSACARALRGSGVKVCTVGSGVTGRISTWYSFVSPVSMDAAFFPQAHKLSDRSKSKMTAICFFMASP